MRALNRGIAQIAARLIVNANAVGRLMARWGYTPAATRVIHNGLSHRRQPRGGRLAGLRRELHIRDDDFLLGTIARTDPKKDLATMVRALAEVYSRHSNVRLLVIGGGYDAYQRELEGLAARLHIQDRVDFLGFREDPTDVMALCRISLLSSVTEGLPNAILESMLLGKPVVATCVGGVPELIEDGVEGWLVPPCDAERFADRVIDLIEHPDVATGMGSAGRSRALRDFSPEAMVQKTVAVYDELLSGTRSP